jgi:GNAT superfamily N-acetyltransferase
VGHRVVVRRSVPGSDTLLTDVLGTLLTLDDECLTLRTDDTAVQVIPLSDVAAAKRVPPRPVRYSEIADLEIAADRCWYTPDREALGGWILRAAQGWTNRANSVLALGDPGLPLDEAISTCQSWYARRGLTTRITVPLPPGRRVSAALTGAGWTAQPLVLVQTAPIVDLAEADRTVVLTTEPTPDFLYLVAARKQSLPDVALLVLAHAPQVRFAEVRGDDGALLAIARGAVTGERLHLGVVEVVAPARRRGLARRVGRALGAWAAGIGATGAVLQVEEHNAGAVALYGSMGFRTHHTYITYRDTP